jgi:hypothetical protein
MDARVDERYEVRDGWICKLDARCPYREESMKIQSKCGKFYACEDVKSYEAFFISGGFGVVLTARVFKFVFFLHSLHLFVPSRFESNKVQQHRPTPGCANNLLLERVPQFQSDPKSSSSQMPRIQRDLTKKNNEVQKYPKRQ